MSAPIIRVEKLSKRYTLGARQQAYSSLRENLMNSLTNPLRRLLHHELLAKGPEQIWALKDVSFEVQHGEVVGIIGRNGAGKSTLLKILARITKPTSGRAVVHGRVGSLLEVGTGFHPELTGRENIYLNGAILGMRRVEIARKFDEIVAFSEIDQFLDTPVKRYSSGMYVRLAFAVAAHLDTEILFVDEVLAVGDAAFQKKCLGKMENVASEGRTILFVSHNMLAISRLCINAYYLNKGEIVYYGASSDVVSKYLSSNDNHQNYFFQPLNNSLPLCLLKAEILSEDGNTKNIFYRDESILIKLVYSINKEVSSVHAYSTIMTAEGVIVLGTSDTDTNPNRLKKRKPGVYECYYKIPSKILNEGDYYVNISLGIPYIVSYQAKEKVLSFTVHNIDKTKSSIHQKRAGVIKLDIPWIYTKSDPFT